MLEEIKAILTILMMTNGIKVVVFSLNMIQLMIITMILQQDNKLGEELMIEVVFQKILIRLLDMNGVMIPILNL